MLIDRRLLLARAGRRRRARHDCHTCQTSPRPRHRASPRLSPTCQRLSRQHAADKPPEGPQTLQEAMWGKEGLAEAEEPKPPLGEPKPGEKLQGDKPQAKPEQKQIPQMPKDLSPEGQARFKQLVSLVKDQRSATGADRPAGRSRPSARSASSRRS